MGAIDTVPATAADLERRFGGLRRLHGDPAYERLRAGRVAVVGLGGVGSWAVEALARSGVARLVLIDFDHVAESNINRQVQALESTLGQAKGEALRGRIAQIHPGCEVAVVDEFVTPGNWPDVLIDACDQVAAKLTLARWGRAADVPVICVGAAGGRREPARVETADLAAVTHDPLLAALRQRLRRAERDEAVATTPAAHAARTARTPAAGAPLGVRCVFSREPVVRPATDCATVRATDRATDPATDDAMTASGGALACHGYGSTVTVTATFGLVAAAEAIECLVHPRMPR
jgi:tRNA A37 threonylcarbamoyladenosine dehydratase